MHEYKDILLSFVKNDKNQRAIILVLSGLIAFALGYYSKYCPGPDVVCLADKASIRGLEAELVVKDQVRTQALREQRDTDRESCDLRVEEARSSQRATNDFLECSDICNLHPQCVSQGRCR